MDWLDKIHVVVFTDADNFEPEESVKKAAAKDKWEGEDEDEDVKVNQYDRHSLVVSWDLCEPSLVRSALNRRLSGPFHDKLRLR